MRQPGTPLTAVCRDTEDGSGDLIVQIPPEIIESLKLQVGDKLDLELKEETLVLTPIRCGSQDSQRLHCLQTVLARLTAGSSELSMNIPIQTCSICERPAVNSDRLPAGTLVSSPLFPHERYKVTLCDACFSTCLAYLRSERRIHIMFHEFEDNADDFGRVPTRDLSHENEASLDALLDALARDIEANPVRLVPLATELVARLNALIAKCDVDLNAPLPPDH